MAKLVLGLGALALVATFVFVQFAPASAQCFEESRPILPTLESARANLNNGAAGVELYRAVADGDVAGAEALIAANPALLTTRTVLPDDERPWNGNSADLLTAAVVRCDAVMMDMLLGSGADPNGAIPGLALTYAILADDHAFATALLDAGASPDAHEPSVSRPLHEALMFGRADAVTLLASYGADVDRADAVGRIPLGSAFSGQNWQLIQALMDAGANPWQVHNQGVLPAYNIYRADPSEPEDRQIRENLLERIQVDAPLWPPVNSTDVRAHFLDGRWPTLEMREAGLFASEEAMQIMRRVGP